MPISEPKPPKKKTKKVEVPMDDDLHAQLTGYAKDKGVGVAALIRAVMRFWTRDWPDDPRNLPPDIEQETKRPPRKPKK